MTKQPDCCICGKPCEPWHGEPTGYGHNPYPFGEHEDDRCCTDCNDTQVVPARIEAMFHKPKQDPPI